MSEPRPKRNFIDRKIDALGKLHGAWLLNQLATASEADLKPRITPATIVAFAISFTLFTANLLVGLAGLYAIVWGWPNIVLVGGGLILLVTWWFLRPYLGAVPEDCVARSDFPALFDLVDQVARELAIKPIEHVRMDQAFNASVQQVGFARAPVLTLGLPLWVSLTAPERVALIGHELAHLANHETGSWPWIAGIISSNRHNTRRNRWAKSSCMQSCRWRASSPGA